MKTTKKPKSQLAGNNINFILNELGMIQQELADLTGLSPGHLSRIINGKRKCLSLPIAFKIAQVLDRPVEYVFISNNSN